MINSILPLIGVFLGGGISVLVVYLQQRFQNKREIKRLKLEKLEAAHKAISKIRYSYSIFTFALSLFPVDKELAQKQISENTELNISLQNLEMLIGFYAPNLVDKIEQLKSLSTDYSQETAKILKDKSDISKTLINSELIMNKFNKIDTFCVEIQNDLAALSKEFIK